MTDKLTDDQKRALAERLNDLARKSNNPISVLIESGRIKFNTNAIPKLSQRLVEVCPLPLYDPTEDKP